MRRNVKEMAGFKIKYEIVWDTIKLKLPDLKQRLTKIIKEIKNK
jgi:uncharacterized protein with HEPN domain